MMPETTASPGQMIDHQRAQHAATAVGELINGIDDAASFQKKGRENLKKYRTVVLNAGTAIRQIGLAQFTAYGLSKGDAHWIVLRDVYRWLERSDATRELTEKANKRHKLTWSGGVGVMNALVERTSAEIMVLEAEAQQYLQWLKRLTEGAWKDLDCRIKELNDNESSESE